jgi:hypothetical protein
LLLWRSIQDAKRDDLCTFDLGRSEFEHSGLITFKDHWHAKRTEITYIRLLPSTQSKGGFKTVDSDWKERAAKLTFRYLPDWILSSAGAFAYKHIG